MTLTGSRFYFALALPPYSSRRKISAAIAYLFVIVITLGPTILEIFLSMDDRSFYSGMLSGIFLFLLAPISQVLGLIAIYKQIRRTKAHGSQGSLSLSALRSQALVFFLVGVSFYFRLARPEEFWKPDPDPDSPRNRPEWNTPLAKFCMYAEDWYWMFGWSVINTLIFALGQGVLASMIRRLENVGELEECEPLLE